MATITSQAPPIQPHSPELEKLLERIAAGAETRERELTPPFEVIDWIKEAGLGRLRIPVEEGGGGASVREFFDTLIALAEADSNVAHILRTHLVRRAAAHHGRSGGPRARARSAEFRDYRRQRVQRA